eukprot:3092647-Rhodomonas_salina.1
MPLASWNHRPRIPSNQDGCHGSQADSSGPREAGRRCEYLPWCPPYDVMQRSTTFDGSVANVKADNRLTAFAMLCSCAPA